MSEKEAGASPALRDRYIRLLRDALSGHLELSNAAAFYYLLACQKGEAAFDPSELLRERRGKGERRAIVAEGREDGRLLWNNLDFLAHTLVGRKRLDQIWHAVAAIVDEGVRGDFLEAGVWRGGASVFAKGVFEAFGDETRRFWLADSYQGLPKPEHEADQGYDLTSFEVLAVGREEVEALFGDFGLLDERVIFLEGWFEDTLPKAPVEEIAFLRLDGDLYKSTMDCLQALYDKVSPGGFVAVDDYGAFPPCRQAVEEFRSRRGITAPLVEIDWTGVYWRKA